MTETESVESAAEQNTLISSSPYSIAVLGRGGANASASSTSGFKADGDNLNVLSVYFVLDEPCTFALSGSVSATTYQGSTGELSISLTQTPSGVSYVIDANSPTGSFEGTLPAGTYFMEARLRARATATSYDSGPLVTRYSIKEWQDLHFSVSAPKPLVAVEVIDGKPRVLFASKSGYTYRVEWKDNLTHQEWSTRPEMSNIQGNGNSISVDDPYAAEQPKRFYRVVLGG